jgi:hypothetical protein
VKERAMGTIRAIVINPTTREISETDLPTEPGKKGSYGTQVGLETWYRVTQSKHIESFELAGNTCTVNGENLADADPPVTDFWQWEDKSYPIGGIGVIAAHDVLTDTWSSTTLSLEQARKAVRFTRREFKGFNVEATDRGVKVSLVAPIKDGLSEPRS